MAGTGVPYFPQTLGPNVVVGRLAPNPGPTEQIPFAQLSAALGIGGSNYLLASNIAGTNTITGTTATAPALAANQVVFLIPANTNTGAVTFDRDAQGTPKGVFCNGAALIGGELRAGIPAIWFFDGVQYHFLSELSFSDAQALVVGATDITKKLKFALSLLSTGTTRTVTLRDLSGTLAFLSDLRTRLTGNTNFYVRTDGSDSNNGLANTAGGAWLTLQNAWNTVRDSYDLAGFTATINVADGTYANFVAKGQFTGSFGGQIVTPSTVGAVDIVGNLTTPANVIITTSAAATKDAIYAKNTIFKIEGMKFVASGTGISRGIVADQAQVTIGKVDFGACTFAHLHAAGNGATITIVSGYNISAVSARHVLAETHGEIENQNNVINLGASFAWSAEFAQVDQLGLIDFTGSSFTGTGSTGKEYDTASNSVLILAGLTLPGNVAGTTATGGQVI